MKKISLKNQQMRLRSIPQGYLMTSQMLLTPTIQTKNKKDSS